ESSCPHYMYVRRGATTEEQWLRLLHAAWSRGDRLIDLDAVYRWVQQQQPLWERRGLTIEIRPPTNNRSKNSMAVLFESETLIAHLIMWDSGEYELERIWVDTEDHKAAPYRPVTTTDDL